MTTFPIYRIEQDNGDGRIRSRMSFSPLGTAIKRIHHEGTTLVEADVMDGGPAGTITAPDVCSLVETNSGDIALQFREGFAISADEAYQAATNPKPWLSCGLAWTAEA